MLQDFFALQDRNRNFLLYFSPNTEAKTLLTNSQKFFESSGQAQNNGKFASVLNKTTGSIYGKPPRQPMSAHPD